MRSRVRGVASSSPAALGEPGFFWTYGASGAPAAADTFTSATDEGETRVAAIAPLPGGDFAVAGWFGDGTNFGTGPLSVSSGGGNLFVARFTASGSCVWATPLGGSAQYTVTGLAADAAGNIWLQTFDEVPDAGGAESYLAVPFDGATGSPAGGLIDLHGDGMGGSVLLSPTIASGDGVTIAAGSELFAVNGGADAGSQVTLKAVLGQDTSATAIAPDGAGGTYVTGMTLGGSFGAIALPAAGPTSTCFVAHADAAGNVTWATYCSALVSSVGTSVAVSGKTLVVSGTVALGLAVPGNLQPLAGVPGTQPATGTPGQVFVEEFALP